MYIRALTITSELDLMYRSYGTDILELKQIYWSYRIYVGARTDTSELDQIYRSQSRYIGDRTDQMELELIYRSYKQIYRI